MKYGFGVDVGGTTVKLGLLSEAGELLEKWELPSAHGKRRREHSAGHRA